MKKRTTVVLAMAGLLVVHHIFLWAIQFTRIYELQVQYLHWRYMHQAIFLMLVPLLAIKVLGRRPRDYGLFWNRDVAVTITTILGLSLVLPLAVDATLGGLEPRKDCWLYLLSTVIFQMLFSGCGEELWFRGMFHFEIDRVFKKRFTLGTTQFGYGLPVGALLFGLIHIGVLGALAGGSLNFGYFAFTLAIGLFLGFVREFVGNVLVVGFLHGAFDTYWYLVKPSMVEFGVFSLGIWFIYYLIFNRKIGAGLSRAEQVAAPTRTSRVGEL